MRPQRPAWVQAVERDNDHANGHMDGTSGLTERATVTMTRLATLLGYADKSKLRELTVRHAKELAPFAPRSGTAKVASPLRTGNVSFRHGQEEAINHYQR